MGQCLRKACPCLLPPSRRVPDKPADGDGTDGGSRRGDAEPPPGSGSIYRAQWEFGSRQNDELSFREGDQFKVLSRKDGWWLVQRLDSNGLVLDSGLVPGTYLVPSEFLQTQA